VDPPVVPAVWADELDEACHQLGGGRGEQRLNVADPPREWLVASQGVRLHLRPGRLRRGASAPVEAPESAPLRGGKGLVLPRTVTRCSPAMAGVIAP
jgi:hypothetical protein